MEHILEYEQFSLKTLAAKAKSKAPEIAFAGTGEVKGVEGSYDATLTKVA